jgi:hypothetical protein
LGLFGRIRNKLSSVGFVKISRLIFEKYKLSLLDAGQELDISAEIWKNISKGNYLPTKNTLFSLALSAHLTKDDAQNLLAVCGYELDYAIVKDVVVSYLLEQKVFNAQMIERALKEYKVDNLFLKKAE